MSRFNPIEKLWAALSKTASAAMEPSGDNNDPGGLLKTDLFEIASAGYVSDDGQEGGEEGGQEGGQAGPGGDGGQGGGEGGEGQGQI